MCLSHSDRKMPASFQDGLFLKFLEILGIDVLRRILNASAEIPGNLSRGERRGNSLEAHKEDKNVKFTSHAIVQF